MRPERLAVSGFGVFREPVDIDFVGADLFALSGPTGAGKSTIIDAIVFALYGSVPRYDDKRKVGPAISEGKVEARVRLDFTVGDESYTALRIVRKKGKAGAINTDEARLERHDSTGGEVEVLAGSADGLTAAVEKLLGLTYDHFTTCVVLPQGDFQRFLHAKPSARQDLLVELLDLGLYGAMAQAAKSRATSAGHERAWVAQQLEELAGVSAEQRGALQGDIVRFENTLTQIDNLLPIIDDLTRQSASALAAVDAANQNVFLLAQLAIPNDVADLGGELTSAAATLADAEAAEQGAATLVTQAEADLDALPQRDSLAAAARDHAERARESARIVQGESVIAAAIQAETAAATEVRAARDASDAATAAVEAARRADRAHEFASSLTVGEPCPVCLQPVAVAPHHDLDDIDALAQAEAAAARSLQQAIDAHTKAAAERATAENLLAQLQERVAECDARLADFPHLAAVEASLGEIDLTQARLKDRRADEAAARKARQAAEHAVKELRAREQAARRAFGHSRDAVVGLAPPPAEGVELVADWQALLEWAAQELPAQRQNAKQAGVTAERAESDRARRTSELHATCAEAGIEVGTEAGTEVGIDSSGRPVRDVAVEALTQARVALTRLDEDLERVEALRVQDATLLEQEQVSALLATHLKSTHFEKWVLDEVLRRLVNGATEILRELSGGTYSLAFDGSANFSVVDHANADVTRSARTLSGGETFLASLALALALADEVAQLGARGTVRLESIFLDEGFGTLDADTLDTVATAIEELGARGRMVGVVSHVRDLADRLPVRFEVAKVGNASTVTRIDT